MSLDVASAKRRFAVMGVVNGVSLMAALGGALGYFRFHFDWALAVFAAALLAGFGAQIWFIASLRLAKKGA